MLKRTVIEYHESETESSECMETGYDELEEEEAFSK